MTTSRASVLVLGGTGFIGSHIVERLRVDYSTRVFSRHASRWQPPVPGVDYQQGDWADIDAVRQALVGIEQVIHCISTTIPKTSNSSMGADISTNLISTVRLLSLCVEAGIKRVIFISSGGSVYGIPRALPVRESDPTEPQTSHGIVKLAIEKYFAVFRQLHGLNYVVLRGSNVYGPRQDPNGQQGLINVLLGRMIQNRPIEVFGTGQIVKDYLYIDDFVEACAKSLNVGQAESPIYNIGSGVGTSVIDIISEAVRVTNKTIRILHRSSLPSDASSVLDINKARAELNWIPNCSLHNGILKTWLWINSVYDHL